MSERLKRAMVTGGSSGIGRCVAETLARDGFDVGILHVGAKSEGEAVVRRIEGAGRRGWSRECHVGDAAAVNDAVGAFVASFGGLEVLVNNAGIFRDSVIWKMTDSQWRDVIDVDLTGAFNCARAAAGVMHGEKVGKKR